MTTVLNSVSIYFQCHGLLPKGPHAAGKTLYGGVGGTNGYSSSATDVTGLYAVLRLEYWLLLAAES